MPVQRVRWGGLAIVALIVVVVVSCSAWAAADQRLRALSVLVEYTKEAPVIDGDASDPAWATAVGLFNQNSIMKAVYTDDTIAFLFTMKAATAATRTPGDWVYAGGRWMRWAEERKDETWATQRTQPFAAMLWEIEPFGLAQGTCTYKCHQSVRQHNIAQGKGDYWLLVSRHGSGPKVMADTGWLLGAEGAAQSPKVGYATDLVDPGQIAGGWVSFAGYAEDLFVVPAAQAGDSYPVMPDGGKARPFRANGSSAPEYIETAPQGYADAATLSEAEIASGEAVRVAALSAAQVAAAWARYEAVHAAVPQLILGVPGPEARSDVKVAARWEDGAWTVEFARPLVTGDPGDVQFADLGALYVATLAAVTYTAPDARNSTGFGFTTPLTFRFAPPPKSR